METERLHILFDQLTQRRLTPQEEKELSRLWKDPACMNLANELLENWYDKVPIVDRQFPEDADRLFKTILEKDSNSATVVLPTPVRRLPVFRQWWGWAAAVLLLLVCGTYFLIQDKVKQQSSKTIASIPSLSNDVLPGSQGAILTLSNGRKVLLDSLGNGIVANQNGTKVILKNGQLVYDQAGKTTGGMVYNTMSTPKGRQYQVRLPDGTQVWLNSESSITYPTLFTGNERKVEITGEAYFEVTKNSKMPFRVKINGQTEIEVLGTHFNINAYKDEAAIKTTLLEGSVKVTNGIDKALLESGQQAQLNTTKKIRIVKSVDIEKIMAWKNGLFNFEGADLDEVMRQLSRWYDIDVVYEKGISDIEFVGEVSKNVSLSGVLEGLHGVGVHFRIEGRRLVVLP
jgi:transmembrane sensor